MVVISTDERLQIGVHQDSLNIIKIFRRLREKRQNKNNTTTKNNNNNNKYIWTIKIVVVDDLLIYVHGKHLRS